MRRPLHRVAHVECPYGAANWAACDAAFKDIREDWDAMQQVILAYKIALRPGQHGYRGDSLFDQLVRYIRGQQEDLTNKDGNPYASTWAMRIRAAIARFIAGDLPRYNLYQIPGLQEPVEQNGG